MSLILIFAVTVSIISPSRALGLLSLIYAAVYAMIIWRLYINYYVFIDQSHFVVKSLLRPTKRIDTTQFERISSFVWDFPFSNTVKIHFKNGMNYRVQGGTTQAAKWDAIVKVAIRRNER
jgi:hypothetical protein